MKNIDLFFRAEISELFTHVRGPTSIISGSVVGIEGSSSLRRASSIRRSYTTGTAGLKRKSICLQVKFQVVSTVLFTYCLPHGDLVRIGPWHYLALRKWRQMGK